MSSSKSEIPIKKIKYGQLRGTVAAKYRHRIALGFTASCIVLSGIFSFLFIKIQPDPNKKFEIIGNPWLFLRKRGYKTALEQESGNIPIDLDEVR